MTTMPLALLANADWLGTLAAVRSLGARGVSVAVAGQRFLSIARWSRYASESVYCPTLGKAEPFLEWLLSFGAEHPGSVLYPTSDEIAWLVACHATELARYYKLYTPSLSSLLALLDKASLASNAKRVGLDVPDTYAPCDKFKIDDIAHDIQYPVYIKPRAQIFGGLGKGIRADNCTELRAAWERRCSETAYDPTVLDQAPSIRLPMLQRCCPGERIYTVDGFVDETGEVSAMLACVKVLQRPRGKGPGIIFEHAPLDPEIEQGLLRLFRDTGFYGVFDAEFLEVDGKRLLIDLNPRFYNHMAFESDRGLDLPWLAYLAATGNREALKGEIVKFRNSPISKNAYVHPLATRLLLAVQRLGGRMSSEQYARWKRQIRSYGEGATNPVWTSDDPIPAFVECASEMQGLRYPRSYFRDLLT
ncbi:MAG: hypothetical protein QM780_08490 [Hyphomicrobium sp.]|uniref:carboxylate--amine ligase n=1 Tax=Hyphomicrobium sp. TaxID=82 RepID=UPI0039E589C9